MGDQARIIKVIIASPGDLEPERRAIPDLFIRWNHAHRDFHLIPAMWERPNSDFVGDVVFFSVMLIAEVEHD